MTNSIFDKKILFNVCDNVKKFIFSINIIQLLVFQFLIFGKQLIFDINSTGLDKHKIILVLSISAFITIWTILLKERNQLIALVMIDVIISLILISNEVYYKYYNTFISIPVLYQYKAISDINKSIRNLLDYNELLLISDFFIFLILYFCRYKIGKKFTNKVLLKNGQKITTFVCVFAISLYTIGYKTYALEKEMPGILGSVFDNNIIEYKMGLMFFHAFDSFKYIKNYSFKDKKTTGADSQEVMKFLENNSAQKNSKYYGMGENLNLIVIQVESLQGFVINKKINNLEITPNLNRFINESMYFNNIYTQAYGGNTSDAEFVVNNSLYPLSEGAVYFRYPNNKYNSLAKVLEQRGYHSIAMHGYSPSFWNREIMYRTLGFNEFYSGKQYKINDVKGMGLSDESFFEQNIDILKKQPTPFYSFMVTLSCHDPFSYFRNDNSLDVGIYQNTQFGDYLKGANYSDKCIGLFLEELKQSGIFDKSIIVIYGDHDAIKQTNYNNLDEFLGNKEDFFTRSMYRKVPLIIHMPSGKLNGKKEIVGGQLDIFPTILNLMGIKNQYGLGSDLLNINNNTVYFRSGDFADDQGYYSKQLNKYYNNVLHKQVNGEDLKEKISKGEKSMKISDEIIENDLLKDILK